MKSEDIKSENESKSGLKLENAIKTETTEDETKPKPIEIKPIKEEPELQRGAASGSNGSVGEEETADLTVPSPPKKSGSKSGVKRKRAKKETRQLSLL